MLPPELILGQPPGLMKLTIRQNTDKGWGLEIKLLALCQGPWSSGGGSYVNGKCLVRAG